MEARRVTIILEVNTEHLLETLRNKFWWKEGMKDGTEGANFEVLQIQVNVIKKAKD